MLLLQNWFKRVVGCGLDLNIPPALGTEEAEDVHHHAPLPAQTAVCREPRTRNVEGGKEKLHGDNILKQLWFMS